MFRSKAERREKGFDQELRLGGCFAWDEGKQGEQICYKPAGWGTAGGKPSGRRQFEAGEKQSPNGGVRTLAWQRFGDV